jgi:hypothetical protein
MFLRSYAVFTFTYSKLPCIYQKINSARENAAVRAFFNAPEFGVRIRGVLFLRNGMFIGSI